MTFVAICLGDACLRAARSAPSRATLCDQDGMLQVGRDSRLVMRVAQQAFAEGSGSRKLQSLAKQDASASRSNAFYAWLYAALQAEADGLVVDSQEALCKALVTPYAQRSADYMVNVARVHQIQRSWRCT
jgi:hypothetical protein